jgi:DNA-binding GntR family transcriptional regulator
MAGDVLAEDRTAPAAEPAGGGLIAERAYRELRDRIVTLELSPGTVLREDDLMAEMGIGRTPLREAVKRLALENLVAVQPRRGTYVTAVDAADIVHITEVRAELEGYAAELAARRMDVAARRTAESLLEDIEALSRADDQHALMRLDQRIHAFTWEASGNPYLNETLERYFSLSLRIWYLVLDRMPGLGHAVHDQAELLRALTDRDGARARRIMREHVLAFQRDIIAAFSRGSGPV